MKRVGTAVSCDIPRPSQARVDPSLLVEAGQPGVQLQEQLDISGIGDASRIERFHLAAEVSQRRVGGARWKPLKPSDRSEEDERGEGRRDVPQAFATR